MSDSAPISMRPAPLLRPRSSKRSDWQFKWLLVAPAAVLILAISIYPLLFSIWVLFVNYDFQIPGHAFVGLRNFKQVIADPVAAYSLWVTVGTDCRERHRRVPARARPRTRPWSRHSAGAGSSSPS